MLASAHIPSSGLSHCLPRWFLLVFPLAAVAEEMLLHLYDYASTTPLVVVSWCPNCFMYTPFGACLLLTLSNLVASDSMLVIEADLLAAALPFF
jgi:hypothetical protein